MVVVVIIIIHNAFSMVMKYARGLPVIPVSHFHNNNTNLRYYYYLKNERGKKRVLKSVCGILV